MRNFNEEEKELLKRMVEQDESPSMYSKVGVDSLFEHIYKDVAANIIFNQKEEAVVVKAEYDKYGRRNFDNITVFTVQRKTILLLSLLDYLKENHLIYFVPITNFCTTFNSDVRLKNGTGENPFESIVFSGATAQDICRISGQAVLPTFEIFEFVRQGFKDKEQKRHDDSVRLQEHSIEVAQNLGNKSIKIAFISLAIAVISLLVTLFSYKSDSKETKREGQTQKEKPTGTVGNTSKPVVDKKVTVGISKTKPVPPDTLKN